MDNETLERELRLLQQASFAWAMACSDYRREEAEDLLQTVYLKIIDGRARFDGKSSFKTWLFAVIRLTARERYRSALRERRGLTLWSSRHVPFLADPSAGDASHIRAALRGLSRRQREVLELVFYHELSIEESAAVMGIGAGSARTHYERGKSNLRRSLGIAVQS